MTREETMSFIDNSKKFGSRLELVRIQKLCELLDNPQDSLRCIHIAGTNGKGSTSVFINNILIDAGYKVGLYTSPFIYSFNERIRVDNEEISDKELVKIMTQIAEKVDIMINEGYEHPTEFELITAAAFLCFKMKKCDYVVLEVGLGGTYDATNIIKLPILSVITSISRDHTEYLGEKIAEIAKNKCGIIKKGCPVVSYMHQPKEALDVIKKTAQALQAPLEIARTELLTERKSTLLKNEFTYNGEKYETQLLGRYQIYNAISAIIAAETLKSKGVNLTRENIQNGIKVSKWSARFEIVKRSPAIILDGSHNADGMNAFVDTAKETISGRIICIFGMLKDKDYDYCLMRLSEISDTIIVTEVDNPRKESVENLEKTAKKYFKEVYAKKDNKNALQLAEKIAKESDTIVALGSLYMMNSIKNVL